MKKQFNIDIGKKLKSLRIKSGFSVYEIAEKMGCPWQNISNIENGTRGASIEKLRKILGFYNRDIEIVIKKIKNS